MANYSDLKDRLGYILLVYGLAILALPWEWTWRWYVRIAIALIVIEFLFVTIKRARTPTPPPDGKNRPASIVSILWFALMTSGICYGMYRLIELREREHGLTSTLIVASTVLAADSAAYLIGRADENTPKTRIPLVRLASPNKTNPGFAAGYVGGVIVGMAVFWISDAITQTAFDGAFRAVMAITFTLPIVAIIGDLIESGSKRWLDIKDTSNWLSTHGGFIDRFDALGLTLLFFSVTEQNLFV